MKLIAPLAFAALTLGACAGGPSSNTAAPVISAAGSPLPTPGYDWFYDEGDGPRLTYGVAESDDVQLGLSCTPGDDHFELMTVSDHGLHEIHLESGGDTERFMAEADESPSGGAFMTARAAKSEPVFQRFRRIGWMALLHDDARIMMAPQPGSSARIARFFSACK